MLACGWIALVNAPSPLQQSTRELIILLIQVWFRYYLSWKGLDNMKQYPLLTWN